MQAINPIIPFLSYSRVRVTMFAFFLVAFTSSGGLLTITVFYRLVEKGEADDYLYKAVSALRRVLEKPYVS